MAFRFLLPPTAPVPPRPLARSSSLTQHASLERFSPAWPMAITLRSFSPYLSRKCATVSCTPLPHTADASRNSTVPSLTYAYTGFDDLPENINPSKPDQRKRAPDQPPWWLSTTVPVSGDLVTTHTRPLMLISVPLSGPSMKQMMFSGERASTCGPFSSTKRTPRPRPPTYLRAHSSGTPLYSTLPAERSTCPMQSSYPASAIISSVVRVVMRPIQLQPKGRTCFSLVRERASLYGAYASAPS